MCPPLRASRRETESQYHDFAFCRRVFSQQPQQMRIDPWDEESGGSLRSQGFSELSAFNASSSPSDWSSLFSRSKFCTTNSCMTDCTGGGKLNHLLNYTKKARQCKNLYVMVRGEKDTAPLTPASLHPWSHWGFACSPALFWSSPWTSVMEI